MAATISEISIRGYKSIAAVDRLPLRSLNVLVGANGAGKSNFLGFLRLLRDLADHRLQLAVQINAGADALLHFGPSVTRQLFADVSFGEAGYQFSLVPTLDNRLVFAREQLVYAQDGGAADGFLAGGGMGESRLEVEPSPSVFRNAVALEAIRRTHQALAGIVVYHFDDTSPTAGVRRWGAINDDERLRPDGSNLAAYLHRLAFTHPAVLADIRAIVRLAAPFFDDFKLRPIPKNPDQIQLEWTQTGTDYPFRPYQLSDGTLRFICLATALLQPAPSATLLFDEPELGLHPYALTLLAELFKGAARGCQVIVATQSPALLNEFEPEDVIVIDRADGRSTFRRLTAAELSEWLAEYSIGELWQKNVFGGLPAREVGGVP